jgi:hypothetical protein
MGIIMRPIRFTLVVALLLALTSWLPAVLAQQSPLPVVAAVEAVGMTVADMDRSIAFYANVLSFETISDVEVTGSEYEHLQGVFGLACALPPCGLRQVQASSSWNISRHATDARCRWTYAPTI